MDESNQVKQPGPSLPHQMHRWHTQSILLLLLILATSCQNVSESNAWLESPKLSQKEARLKEVEQRELYQKEKDPAAIQWLLVNRIRTGMPVSDVDHILGEDGQREYETAAILKNDGNYRQTDEVYRWGPDRMGRTYMLVFREDRLVNFDAHQKDFHDPFLGE